MIDLCLKDKCLKLNWIRRLCNDPGCWKDYFLEKLPVDNDNLDYFFNCNLKYCEIPFYINKNSIWNDVMKYWCEFNFEKEECLLRSNEILAAHIWYNSNIKVGNKVIFWKQWYNKGLEIINDVIDPSSGNFLSWQQIRMKFDLNGNYLMYYSIINSIPKAWRHLVAPREIVGNMDKVLEPVNESMNDSTISVEKSLFDLMNESAKPAKLLYNELIINLSDEPYDRVDKWNLVLDPIIEDIDFYKLLFENYYCTNSVRIRSFMYKFAMRDLFPMQRMYLIKKSDSPLCRKCELYEENITHMFLECTTVVELWDALIVWLNDQLGIRIAFDSRGVLINEFNIDISFAKVLTFVFTLAKLTIYNNRDNTIQVNIVQIINQILKYEYIERAIAIAKQNLQKHVDKWQGIYQRHVGKMRGNIIC